MPKGTNYMHGCYQIPYTDAYRFIVMPLMPICGAHFAKL
jgi:hypothetical protein